jgi:hypothetical protein
MFGLLSDIIKPFRNHLLTIAFVGGFVIDNLTLNRVDQLFDNIVLAVYVCLAFVGLMYLYLGTSGKMGDRIALHASRWAPLLVQFAYGGLMSGLLVFYSRSGSWWTSWPFLLLMLGVIFGNEFVRRRSERLIFNLGVFFVALFSYIVLIVPVAIGKMGDEVFLLSGVAALMLFGVSVKLLYRAVPNFMAMNTRTIVITTASLYIGLNVLYFTNLIPPIPLSMKEMGIYHNVEKRAEGGYVLSYEKGPWYALWHTSDNTYHYSRGDRVYCYASVFAPTRFKTNVTHHWEYYNEAEGTWSTHETITFPIDGGRADGYRGYSFIESVQDGVWRCSVETERGQVIGRSIFTIVTGTVPKPLVTRVDS